METIERYNHAQMRKDINAKVEEQRFLKNQKKTKKLVGERKIEPKDAAYKYMTNREDLRVMYAAFGLSRGKSFSVTENHYPEESHPLKKFQGTIDRILGKYKMLVKIQTVI